MATIEPDYEMTNGEQLSKFLLGAIRDVRKEKLDLQQALVISKLSDNYTKNEIANLMKDKANRKNQKFNLRKKIEEKKQISDIPSDERV